MHVPIFVSTPCFNPKSIGYIPSSDHESSVQTSGFASSSWSTAIPQKKQRVRLRIILPSALLVLLQTLAVKVVGQ